MSPGKKNRNQDAPANEPEATSKEEVEQQNEEGEEGEEEEEDEDQVINLDELDLPEPVLKRVKGLRKLHEQYETIEDEYKQARLALEKQFLARKEELYNIRTAVLSGESEINEEGVTSKIDASVTVPEGEKGVPSFWLTALSSHPTIGSLITEEDVPALESLVNITVAYDDEWTTFTLSFHFNENEFFSNTVLTKKYYVSPDLLDDQSPALMQIDGSEIQWKTGKNLCQKEITKKQKAKSGRNKGQIRTITKTLPKPSFFHYFDERDEDAENEDGEGEDGAEEEQDGPGRIKLNLDEDYDIGHTIRTAIIPEAILFFTGEADVDDGMMFGDEEDDDEEGEGDEDDDEEGEEGDDAPAEGKKKNKKNAGAAGGAAAGGEKAPECKQN